MYSIKNSRKTAFIVLAHMVFIVFCFLCIFPLIIILSTSLSAEKVIISDGYTIIPRNISFESYIYIFKNSKQILNSYFISISTTALGMVLGLLINSMIAYPISRKDFIFGKKISFYVFFTMLFSGGLVPTYMLITGLKMKDTFWVLVIPYLVAAWNILLLRTFFMTIPAALVESAKIDGSSELGSFFRIILPLSKPSLATVGLLIAFHYWNDYWLGLLYISDRNLVNLQYMFYKTMANLEFYINNIKLLQGSIKADSMPKESTRLALCILTAAPMMIVFPFFQKYFVKGMVVGSVKG